MSEIAQITDYESRLVALLPGQFKLGANWLSLFAALAGTGKAFQLQEDLIYLLWQQRSDFALAVGAQLEQWGELVGLPNEGWTDNAYRSRIRVWLQVLRSTGTPDELIRIVTAMAEAGSDVMYWETPPASYSIQHSGGLYQADQALALDVARYAAKADPAGVGIGQVIALPLTPFLFGSVGASGFSVQGGATYGLLSTDTATEAGV